MTGVRDFPNSERRSLRRRLAFPALFVGTLILIALAAPLIAPYEPNEMLETIELRSKSPSSAHPFGTDSNSRDVLTRVIYGARVSLTVASLSVAIALTFGTLFGALAAFAGGRLESLMMRILDVLLSLPRLLVLLAITAFWGKLPIPALALLLGVTGWYDVARLVHGETQQLLGRDFIAAARASGVRRSRVFARHMLPHLVPVLAVMASLGVAATIALEAGLSYLNLGVQDPTPSWGSIMREGMGLVDSQWWLTIFPGIATVLAVLACNAFAEALRDVSPRNQVDA